MLSGLLPLVGVRVRVEPEPSLLGVDAEIHRPG